MRCRISLVGTVLAVSILAAPATSPGKALDAPGAVVSAVTGIPAQSLPSVSLPSPPPAVPVPPQAPVEVPPPPQLPAVKAPAPAVPQIPAVKVPTPSVPGTTPSSSHSVPTPSTSSAEVGASGGSSSVGEDATATKGFSGGSAEAAPQTPAPSPGRGGEGWGSRDTRRTGTEGVSVDPARAAPLRVFFAYVWPAIALGPAGQLLGALQAQWERVTQLSVADVSRLLVGLTGVAGESGVAGVSERSAGSDPSPADARTLPVPSGGEISLLVFIIACAALAALLVFTLRREFRSMHRWPL